MPTAPSAQLLPSWVPVGPDSHFPLNNLPYGVFSTAADPTPRPCVRIGDRLLDLRALAGGGLLSGSVLGSAAARAALHQPSLNAFMALGPPAWDEARATLQRLLAPSEGGLRDDGALLSLALLPVDACTMHLPAAIGDYTDFYASREHATNLGSMFRGRDSALQPNWCAAAAAPLTCAAPPHPDGPHGRPGPASPPPLLPQH